jgi:hypothetical protein
MVQELVLRMLVLHLGVIIRWWIGYALGALFAPVGSLRASPRFSAKGFLDAASWVEAAFLVAAVGAGGVLLIQLLTS